MLRRHLEELAALWRRREEDLFADHLVVADLARIEDRALAHLDALRIGGAHAVAVARPLLGGKEWSDASAAALVLLDAGRPDLDEAVLAAFLSGPEPVREGVRIALRHAGGGRAAPRLTEAATAGEPAVRAAAADVLAFRRLPPPRGLDALAADPGERTRVLACGAIGRFGGPWGGDSLERGLQAEAPTVQRAALEASARLGLPGVERYCRSAAMRTGAPSTEALRFLGVLAEPNDVGFLTNLAAVPALAEAALDGLGATGRPEAVPFLLGAIGKGPAPEAAARALARITGIATWDVASAAEDWRREGGRFSAGRRYQAGLEVPEAPGRDLLDRLPLASRRDVYLRYRWLARTAPDLELEALVTEPDAFPSGAC